MGDIPGAIYPMDPASPPGEVWHLGAARRCSLVLAPQKYDHLSFNRLLLDPGLRQDPGLDSCAELVRARGPGRLVRDLQWHQDVHLVRQE